MGLEQNYGPGGNLHGTPRGILNFSFTGTNATEVAWKVTGNLGGEHYVDRVRGPLNEGGLYPERQGFHLPGVNTSLWSNGGPFGKTLQNGVWFYYTTFELNLPRDFDTPLSLKFRNTTAASPYRAQLYVNGYQFGKYGKRKA